MGANDLFETQDGSHSIFSSEFGVSYHSKYGAIQETMHVFIKSGLFEKALQTKEIAILEIGFGTGLNAYMTMLEAQKRELKINYTAVEAFPITLDLANQLNYPEILEEEKEPFLQLHQSEWDTSHLIRPSFQFLKKQMKFEAIQAEAIYDLIYFDAFAPTAQPELWEEPILKKMYSALRPNGIWVSYCAKGAVKRGLKAEGFHVETLPGPPGKREMIRAVKK